MNSIRRWLYKPKKTDRSLLAQFYYADEELNMVAAELDSFDGRKDPERCTLLVNQLRSCQDKVLNIIQKIMDEAIVCDRANRDFRVKFPDDILQESLAGQLWFGAECLAAGSTIMNREIESASMRPLARALTKNLDSLRSILREQCLTNINTYTARIKESLTIFDKLFAEFELSYVSAMVPVKTMKEYDTLQEVTVLFSETVHRAQKLCLLTQEMIDDYDPALMFTIPRLAIVCGLLVHPEGPLNPDMDPANMSEMFRPFQPLLYKIRELLYTLSSKELFTLEKSLCSADEPSLSSTLVHDDTLLLSEVSCQTDNMTPLGSLDPISLNISELNSMHQNIIVHSPNSGSPVTPDSDKDFSMGHMSHSPSVITIVHQGSPPGGPDDDLHSNQAASLKCTSKDSGISSENISSTESVHDSVFCDYHAAVHGGGHDGVSDRSLIHGTQLFDVTRASVAEQPHRSSTGESRPSSEAVCYEIIGDLLSEAVEGISRSPSSADEIPSVMRQSWQYDIQFEIPRISIQPSSSVEETEIDNSQDGTGSDSMVTIQNSAPVKQNYSQHSNSESSTKTKYKNCHCGTGLEKDHKGSSKIDRISSAMNVCTFEKLRHMAASTSCGGGHDDLSAEACLDVPRIQRLRYTESICSTCSSCRSGCSMGSDCDWDRESCASSETSSYNSECHDDEEIALAIQAAELASRNEARSRFQSSTDLIHRLFVCISGVADQLQTNFASDLRSVLKSVFDMNCSELVFVDDAVECGEAYPLELGANMSGLGPQSSSHSNVHLESFARTRSYEEPPPWVPDEQCPHCTSCKAPFSFVRRRHHCRNCGKVFCSRCSSNFVPLPHYGHMKPVRVCNHCFIFQVTHFTVDE